MGYVIFMPAPFNLTNFSNASSFTGVVGFVDAITGGWFTPVIVMVVFSIAFLGMGHSPKEEAFAGASFIAFVASVILWAMAGASGNVIGTATTPMIVTLVMLIGSVGMLIFREG